MISVFILVTVVISKGVSLSIHHCYYPRVTNQEEWLRRNTIRLYCPASRLIVSSAVIGYSTAGSYSSATEINPEEQCPVSNIPQCSTPLYVVNMTCAGKQECLLFHQPLPILPECHQLIRSDGRLILSFLRVDYSCAELTSPLISEHKCLKKPSDVSISCPVHYTILLHNVYIGYSPRVDYNCPPTIYQCTINLNITDLTTGCLSHQNCTIPASNGVQTLEKHHHLWPLCTENYTTNYMHIQYSCFEDPSATNSMDSKATSANNEVTSVHKYITTTHKAMTSRQTVITTTHKIKTSTQKIITTSQVDATQRVKSTGSETVLTATSAVQKTATTLQNKQNTHSTIDDGFLSGSSASVTETMAAHETPTTGEVQEKRDSTMELLTKNFLAKISTTVVNNLTYIKDLNSTLSSVDVNDQYSAGTIAGVIVSLILAVILIAVTAVVIISRKQFKQCFNRTSTNLEKDVVVDKEVISKEPGMTNILYDDATSMQQSPDCNFTVALPRSSVIHQESGMTSDEFTDDFSDDEENDKPIVPDKPAFLQMNNNDNIINSDDRIGKAKIGIVQPNSHLVTDKGDDIKGNEHEVTDEVQKRKSQDESSENIDVDNHEYDEVAISYSDIRQHYLEILPADPDIDDPVYDTIPVDMNITTEDSADDNTLIVSENEAYNSDCYGHHNERFTELDLNEDSDTGTIYDEVCI